MLHFHLFKPKDTRAARRKELHIDQPPTDAERRAPPLALWFPGARIKDTVRGRSCYVVRHERSLSIAWRLIAVRTSFAVRKGFHPNALRFVNT